MGSWTFEVKLNILSTDGNNGIMEWWNDELNRKKKVFLICKTQ
jgi:hypothetical protein